jgi:hypothetical protein
MSSMTNDRPGHARINRSAYAQLRRKGAVSEQSLADRPQDQDCDVSHPQPAAITLVTVPRARNIGLLAGGPPRMSLGRHPEPRVQSGCVPAASGQPAKGRHNSSVLGSQPHANQHWFKESMTLANTAGDWCSGRAALMQPASRRAFPDWRALRRCATAWKLFYAAAAPNQHRQSPVSEKFRVPD